MLHAVDFSVTIANGVALSNIVDVGTIEFIGFFMPAAWTAANLTFRVSQDGVTFFDLFDSAGVEVSVAASASKGIGVIGTPLQALSPWRYIIVRSGTTGTPVNQAGARTILIVGKS